MNEPTIKEIDEALMKTGAQFVRFYIGGGEYVTFSVKKGEIFPPLPHER